MNYPTVRLADRNLIILVGPEADLQDRFEWRELPANEQFRQAALKNPDAVAFSFARGQWFAAA